MLFRKMMSKVESIRSIYEYKVEEVQVKDNEFTYHSGGKRRIQKGNIDSFVKDKDLLFRFDKSSLYRLLTAYGARKRNDVNYAKVDNKMNSISANLGWFIFLSGLYFTVLLSSNIFAGRFIHVGGLVLPGGIYGFPLTFAILDILTEHFGARAAIKVVFTGLINLFAFVALIYAYYYWGPLYTTPQNHDAVTHFSNALYNVFFYKDNILSIVFSCACATFISDIVNCRLMQFFKNQHQSRNLWVRCVLSTTIAEAIFSISWITVYSFRTGYVPSGEILWASVSQTIVKSMYEFLMLPFTYMIIYQFKKNDKERAKVVSCDF